MRSVCWKSFCVLLSLVFLTVFVAAASAEIVLAKISGTNVNVRSEPSRSGGIVGRFSGGEQAVILEERSGNDPFPWSRVIARSFRSDGALVEGWVYGQFIEPLPQGEWHYGEEGDPAERFTLFIERTRQRIGDTPEETVVRLGMPSSREDTRRPGRHDPDYMVDYYELLYPGLTLHFFRTPDSSGLIGVEIRTGEHVLGEGIRLGAAAATVFRELGIPQHQNGSVFAWTDEPGYAVLELTFAEELLALVDFSVDLD